MDNYCPVYYQKLKDMVVTEEQAKQTYQQHLQIKSPSSETKRRMQSYIKWMNEKAGAVIPEESIEPTTLTDADVARKYIQLLESAQRRGKEFNLSLKDVKQLLQRKTCFYTGFEFVSGDVDYHRTIDRVDANKGYVKGNVVACCSRVNQVKEKLVEGNMAFFKNDIKTLLKFVKKLEEMS